MTSFDGCPGDNGGGGGRHLGGRWRGWERVTSSWGGGPVVGERKVGRRRVAEIGGADLYNDLSSMSPRIRRRKSNAW